MDFFVVVLEVKYGKKGRGEKCGKFSKVIEEFFEEEFLVV